MYERQPEQCKHPPKVRVPEFLDKRREETNKVKENIPKNLAGNMTAVEIRTRNVPIKRGRQVNVRGSLRGEKGEGRKSELFERKRECVTSLEQENFLL